MSYESDVAFWLEEEVYTYMQNEIALHTEEEQEEIKKMLNNAKRIVKDDSFLFAWPNIVWDTRIPAIAFFDEFFDAMPDEFHDQYVFTRIGDELNDNIQLGQWWDNPFNLMLSRSLDFKDAEGNPVNIYA